jgi:hypothetical protein
MMNSAAEICNEQYPHMSDNLTNCQIVFKILHSEMLQSHRVLKTNTCAIQNLVDLLKHSISQTNKCFYVLSIMYD